jgi:ATP-dependent Clp protease ATP-binding subunit ClpA
MFERFTERARKVAVLADAEARAQGLTYVGTEHILIGLIDEGDGRAAQVLSSLGLKREQVARLCKFAEPGAPGPPGNSIPFTPRAKETFEKALREALSLGHNYVGTEHLLLALTRQSDGLVAGIFSTLGGDEAIRANVFKLLTDQGTDTPLAQAERRYAEVLRHYCTLSVLVAEQVIASRDAADCFCRQGRHSGPVDKNWRHGEIVPAFIEEAVIRAVAKRTGTKRSEVRAALASIREEA